MSVSPRRDGRAAAKDDLDLLLDEITARDHSQDRQSNFQPPPIKAEYASVKIFNVAQSSKAQKLDGIDDLLDELAALEGVPNTSAPTQAKAAKFALQATSPPAAKPLSLRSDAGSSPSPSLGKAKCSTACLGGTNDTSGLSVGRARKACDRLRCTQCDFRCLSFPDATWAPASDYLFFRNHMPDMERLRENLVPRPGSVASCCQCSWHSANALVDLRDLPALKWVCGGH
ncbi:retinal maintenance-domain-containing protein [Geranomyces variabilis]|nr:retinal maintenance-domain-containing protein [Geranomyces variabilis]KAJ3143619.1 hypothetical protein HDU90_000382 [Geranomyces variabilis]